MIATTISLAVSLLAVIVVLTKARQEAEAQWALERRELLNRIQAPDRLPSDGVRTFPDPDPEQDLAALVGTIDLTEPEED